MIVFDKEWFLRHQKKLVWLANNPIGRVLFKIPQTQKRIIGILPNALFFEGKNSQEFIGEYRTHEKYAKRLYYGLFPIWKSIHNFDMFFANNFVPEWNMGFDTLAVYPDAGTGLTTVDGRVSHIANDSEWSTLTSGAGTSASATVQFGIFAGTVGGTISNRFNNIQRSIFLFDTHALTTLATISAAIVSLFGSGKVETFTPSLGWNLNIFSSNPVANNSLSTSDYSTIGTTPFSTPIAYSAWSTSAYNNYTLVADGISAISLNGVTKFATRNQNYDAANIQPTWQNSASVSMSGYYADQPGVNNDPKLTITYTLPVVPAKGFFSFF